MNRIILGYVLFVFLGAAAPAGAGAVERIALEKPLVSSDQAELAGVVSDLMEQASTLVTRLYPGMLVITPQGVQGQGTTGQGAAGRGDYAVGTIASKENGVLSLVLSMTRTSDGSKTPNLAWSAPATPEMPLWLARAIFLLWSSFHGYLADGTSEPPVFVDDLPASVLNPTMPPLGIAVTSRGSLAVALITSCLELDHTYRRLGEPAKSLADKGMQLYAGSVAATPGGSLILKPTMGRDLYRIQPNAPEAQKIPTGLELSSIFYWMALPDGSALLVDAANRKAYKAAPGKRRQELPLFPNPSSWPTAYAAGPDGSIWVYDPQLRGVRVFTSEGTPLDIVLPLTDPASVAAPTAMAVGPDGGFVLLSAGSLSRFRPDGRLAWTMTSLAGSDQAALPASAVLAVDWSRGLIYLCDLAGRRISKVMDRAWCRENGIRNEFEEKLVTLLAGKSADEAGTLSKAAKLYETAGSTVMAKAYWQKVQDADPGNPDADARVLAIETDELRAEARDLDQKARTTRAAIGMETARPWSVQAIQKYELLLSKAPGDRESRAAMEDLRKLFNDTAPEQEKKTPLSITEFHLVNLFPSLMHWYGLHPPGTVTVTNSLSVPVQKVRASLFIPGYMELPFETADAVDLAPGKSATFSLSPVFKQEVLATNQEDMAVQTQVTVTWTAGGDEQSTTRGGSTTIYRNTALTWDDTRKISSYITPNESTVSGFAARALSGAGSAAPRLALSRSMLQAVRICDALGAYGITYVQNLDAPFSRALGKAEVIDAVHFPRITLQNRTGDCSDTTALLCSLLESVGIHTAALTTPGHIFCAFDTDEPAENARYFRNGPLEVIAKNGKVWVPVETTILSQGFVAAWTAASDLVRKYSSSGPYEFITVTAMRDAFPALPLPRETMQIADPAASRVDAAFAASLSGVADVLYTHRLKTMDAALASLSGRQALRARVEEGVLHAMFGHLDEAAAAFTAAIADDPTMVSPYVNLANVKLLGSDGEGALRIVKQGLARNAGSTLLNLLAARITSAAGDPAAAAVYMAKVQKLDADLASRFSPGGPSAAQAGTPQRSAQAGAAAGLIWGGDQ